MVEKDGTARDVVLKWHERAQIDYSDLYMRLYVAYNAWFRQVTRTSFDREGIARLKKRFVIWDDYLNGRTMQHLTPSFEQIVAHTHDHPLHAGNRWDGQVQDAEDWRGLIHYWYQVRCDLFHGSLFLDQTVPEQRVRLAYESLNIFMTEITDRMKHSFTHADYERLKEIQLLAQTPGNDTAQFRDLQQALHQKFINSPDLWNVDMVRA